MLFYLFGTRFSPWVDIVVLALLVVGGRALISRFDLTHWRRRLAVFGLVVLFFALAPYATWVVLMAGIDLTFLFTQQGGSHTG